MAQFPDAYRTGVDILRVSNENTKHGGNMVAIKSIPKLPNGKPATYDNIRDAIEQILPERLKVGISPNHTLEVYAHALLKHCMEQRDQIDYWMGRVKTQEKELRLLDKAKEFCNVMRDINKIVNSLPE